MISVLKNKDFPGTMNSDFIQLGKYSFKKKSRLRRDFHDENVLLCFFDIDCIQTFTTFL